MSNGQVLIIEDEQSIREVFKDVMEAEGYETLTATNGQEAMDLLNSGTRPDLILLDLMMPVMDGTRFLEISQQNKALRDIPVVVISAIADETNTRGARSFISKPVDLDHLLSTVSHYAHPLH